MTSTLIVNRHKGHLLRLKVFTQLWSRIQVCVSKCACVCVCIQLPRIRITKDVSTALWSTFLMIDELPSDLNMCDSIAVLQPTERILMH